MRGMLARVSTLFTTVGFPKRPTSTGNGGLLRGSPRFPSVRSTNRGSPPPAAPRRAPLPRDRLQARGLPAADVRPGAAPDLDVEGEAFVHDARAEESAGA